MSKAGRRIFDGAASFFVPVKMHKPFAHRPGDANGLFLCGVAGQNADFVDMKYIVLYATPKRSAAEDNLYYGQKDQNINFVPQTVGLYPK